MAEARIRRVRRVHHPKKKKGNSKSKIVIDLRNIGEVVETDVTLISKETAL